MAEEQKPWARSLARFSVLAPVAAGGIGLSSSMLQVQTREMKLIIGGAATLTICVGFVIALIALAGSLRRGREGAATLACVGLSLNGICLLGFIVLLPAVARVAHMQNTRYTPDQMRAMPQVIPGSKAILNEDLGFRMEIPREFFKNRSSQPPQVLYSFIRVGPEHTVDLGINVERLGGRIRPGPLEPDFYAGLRSKLPPDAQIEQEAMLWKSHQLDAFKTRFSVGPIDKCAWAVQVPLAREAIQIVVAGPEGSSEECRELLQLLLTGVQGVSNWDPPCLVMPTPRPALRPGPRTSMATESAGSTPPPADPVVAPGHSEIRTFSGTPPEIPGRNPKLIYEFDLSIEPVLIHVPPNYDGSQPFGLIVHIPADGPCKALPPGWDKVLEERRILLVSPQKALNWRDTDQRCGLAAVCAVKMQELYKIDSGRVFASGYSGGARVAAELGYYHANLFRGTIQSCGADFHRPVPAVHAVPLERDRRRRPYGVFSPSTGEIKTARKKVRFVIITGARDFRYGHLLDIYEGGLTKDGFQARLIDVPLMEHTVCGPHALCEALDFIERDPHR